MFNQKIVKLVDFLNTKKTFCLVFDIERSFQHAKVRSQIFRFCSTFVCEEIRAVGSIVLSEVAF